MRNPQLKRAYETDEYTPQMVLELQKCMSDPIYFLKNYIKIQHPTRGTMKFEMFEYQERFVQCMHENRFVITLQPRQCGKTLTAAMYLLWYALFNKDSTLLIASKNQTHAMEIAARVKFAYEELPNWIKCGLKYFNMHKVEFDNGSRIVCEATTEKTGRGLSLTKIYLDELAFISPKIQMKLWASLTPTLSTGGSAIISSTPNGDTDLFASLWRGAMSGQNGYVPFQVHWREHPERGEEYWDQMVSQLGLLTTRQEVGCVFGTTVITTRNKLTGVVRNDTIEDVAKELLTHAQDTLQNNLDSRERKDSEGFGQQIVRDSSHQRKSQRRPFRESGVHSGIIALRAALRARGSVRGDDDRETSWQDTDRTERNSAWRETNARNLQEDFGNQESTVRSRISTVVQRPETHDRNTTELECKSAWKAELFETLRGTSPRDSKDPRASSRSANGTARDLVRVGASETFTSYEVPRVLDTRNLQSSDRTELVFLIPNKTLEILTPSGFQNFEGIRVTRKNKILRIRTSGTELKCSIDHKFGNVSAADLIVGDHLDDQEIISIEELSIQSLVYDPVEVQNGHLYITNGVVSHNCEFLSSDAMLVNSMKLQQIVHKEPLYTDMGFKFWVPQEEIGGGNKTYLVSIDPATGGGNDFSVIEVFDFPGLNQVAEWRSNEINIPLLYAKVKWILNKLSAYTARGRSEVLWTFERNGIGEAMCALFVNDEKQPEHAELYNDVDGKYGVYTTGKTKILACLQLKSLVEKIKNGLTLNSEILIFELKNFVAKGGSYEGKKGSTDDCVSATLGITRLIKRLADYNEQAFKTVNEYIDPDEADDGFGGEPMPFAIL